MKKLLVMMMVVMSGCLPGRGPTTAPTTMPVSGSSTTKPADARPMVNALTQLEVYQLEVPLGTLSRSEQFWKRIDEDCIDVATRDRLLRNGMRVGVFPAGEWDFFRNIIAQNPNSAKRSIFLPGSQAIELEMGKELQEQILFYYDEQNRSEGRSYDRCQNLITFAFQPAPRKPDSMRIVLCPVVRSSRKRLEFTGLNEEREIVYQSPEHLYNANLRVDVKVGDILVVSPSEDAKMRTLIGNAFFVRNDTAEQKEVLLLVLPVEKKLEEKPPPR